MIWAVLVAVGVAVVSMTLFGARITRRPPVEDRVVPDLEVTDADDPWAAWKPRPISDMDRPRPRLWPIGAALTGLVMVGAGFAGARQTLWTTSASADTASELTTPAPYIVEVKIPASPSPNPTPKPTVAAIVAATAKPQVAAPATTAAPAAPAAPAASAPATTTGEAPTLTGSGSCSGGTINLSYTGTAHGSELSWLAVYVDGKVVKGGPISGASHSSSWQGSGSPGDHALEVSVEDEAGRTARKQFHVSCG